MAKLADAPDLGSGSARIRGSSPLPGKSVLHSVHSLNICIIFKKAELARKSGEEADLTLLTNPCACGAFSEYLSTFRAVEQMDVSKLLHTLWPFLRGKMIAFGHHSVENSNEVRMAI